MKKIIAVCLAMMLVTLPMVGCSGKNDIKCTVEGNVKTYYEMTDGTWLCDDISYKHRLEITGRMNNATRDTTFVYLSNVEISFEQAWKASGLSSNSNDYFSLEDAVFVEYKTD